MAAQQRYHCIVQFWLDDIETSTLDTDSLAEALDWADTQLFDLKARKAYVVDTMTGHVIDPSAEA